MKKTFSLIFMALYLGAMLISAKAEPSIKQLAATPQCNRWVDSVYSGMTMRQRVAQLFVPKVNPANVAAAKQTIHTYVKTLGVGGLLFSKGTIDQYAQLTDYAQSIAAIPLVMTLDGEWGPAMRVTGTTRFPYNMSLGAIDDERLLYEYGKEVARECKLLGINVNFAPVLDVNSNPANPVIGYRSFGEDPERVARLGTAYSRGLEAGGIMAVGKHFPGHGDTNKDSHKELPVVSHSRQQLHDIDLLPFRRFIDAGMSGIMVGHLNVPAIDRSGTPTSLSHKATTGLLKEEMGFDGLIWTDGLAMKGASAGTENNCVSALNAGVDILLESAAPRTDIAAVVTAVENGVIPASVIESRCKKVLAYKYALGLADGYKPVSDASLKKQLDSPEADAVNRRLTAAMITCLENKEALLPIGDTYDKHIAVVNIGEGADNTFSHYCSKYADIKRYSASTALTATQLKAIKSCDMVIAGIYNDKAASIEALRQLEGCRNLVTVFFLNPYKLSKFAPLKSGAVLLTGENTALAQEYAAQGVFGGIRVNGSLPVNVKGIAPLGRCVGLMKTRLGYSSPAVKGLDPTLDYRVDSLVKTGLQTGAFPGCQVLIAKSGDIILDKHYGYTDNTKTHKVNDSTLYDLASVSKIAGTLPGLMLAYDEGLYKLDDPAYKYIPGLQQRGKDDITPRQLLLHESGLPAAINLSKFMMDTTSYTGKLIAYRMRGDNTIKIAKGVYANRNARLRRDITSKTRTEDFDKQVADGLYVSDATVDSIMEQIYAVDTRDSKNYLYSDLNFALLMDMEQNVSGQPHDMFVENGIFRPLGATHTLYRPLSRFSAANIASTEHDKFMRKQALKGYVHDELAAFSGGVQGNAGLFSTAGDLAKLCQMWLNGGSYAGRQIMSPATVNTFTGTKSDKSRRKLGFDGPDTDNPDKTPTAKDADPSTFGHIGFTGTCIWVDPKNELIYIFLSNRVNPTRDNSAFSRLNIRPAIMDAVYRAAK